MRCSAWISVPVFVVVFGLACAPPSAKSAAIDSSTNPVKVVTFIAAIEEIPELLPLVGTLKANAESDVAANAAGQVIHTLVERGTVVSKSTPLVVLDARMVSLSTAEARANLEGIRTQKALADSECERNLRLLEKHAITKQEFEKADSSCKLNKQSLAAAESRYRQSTLTLGDATVHAPFDGVVSERFVNVGEYVSVNTKIVHVVQTDPIRVELTAGESDASAISVGQTVQFRVKALPDRIFSGTVQYVAPALRKATRDLVFEAVTPNADGLLKPGMFVTATLEGRSKAHVVVPQTAVRKNDDAFRAFVVTNGHIEERVVQKIRDLEDGRAVIGRGIVAGEHVVTTNDVNLKDGLSVVE